MHPSTRGGLIWLSLLGDMNCCTGEHRGGHGVLQEEDELEHGVAPRDEPQPVRQGDHAHPRRWDQHQPPDDDRRRRPQSQLLAARTRTCIDSNQQHI